MQMRVYLLSVLNSSASLAMAPNMPEFCTRQGSQYMNFGNMAEFWICQSFEYPGLTQATEFPWMSKHGS